MDPALTAAQADFIIDFIGGDPDDALAQCETVDDSGQTVYQINGDPDAKTFLSNLVEALTPLATPVDDEEDTGEAA